LVSPIYEVVRVKDPESTSTEFLFQLLSSERQINFFATLTEGTLIERMAVKVDTFLDQTVCIPSRREDQDALAAILSLADREISSLGQLGSALKDQKRGLMQQLLTGKMRVRV
jgi:type I restriction enzyme S subunit